MTPEQKLARIFDSLKEAGIDALVMGGHAVRYYGIDRNTVDFDLVTAIATTDELRARISTIESLGQVREQHVWRQHDFARFEIGRLPDGREEWLEFWIRNHLLGDFGSLKARAEAGMYGGGTVSFLSISDLLRSKETERETDWLDIAMLEEIQDARNDAAIGSAPESLARFLANLRSRRGMDRAIDKHILDDGEAVVKAIAACSHPATFAFLSPLTPLSQADSLASPVEPATLASLRTVAFACPKHFALVEICRRAYKRQAIDADRADKQKRLAEQNRPG